MNEKERWRKKAAFLINDLPIEDVCVYVCVYVKLKMNVIHSSA